MTVGPGSARHPCEAPSGLEHDAMVGKVVHWQRTLQRLTRTRISWHALYAGDFAASLAGRRVLELASGDGLNALIMARLGAHVTAIDASPLRTAAIRRIADAVNLTTIHPVTGDFRTLELAPRSFDLVIGKELLHRLTREEEDACLALAARVLRPEGEARFCEPAINSTTLDAIRWIVPVRGRPSKLATRAFRRWRWSDQRPARAHDSRHYVMNGARFFGQVTIMPFGSIERLHRVLPARIGDRFCEWAYGLEPRLPFTLRWWAARAQLIVYRRPRAEPSMR
jgi:ubiquinone/menaquinone biosynthesis C-methylase UbiE